MSTLHGYSAWHLAPVNISLMLQVDHEDKQNAALNAFNELWKSKFAEDSLLVFSTGRSLALYNELRVCCNFPPDQRHALPCQAPEKPLHCCSTCCKLAMTAQHTLH